jgi:hypothetical protein
VSLQPRDFRQQWELLDKATRREIVRSAWRGRRAADPRTRRLVTGYAQWLRSRWWKAVAYLALYVGGFVMLALVSSKPAMPYVGAWAVIFVVGLSFIALIAWRMTETMKANRANVSVLE